MTHKIVIAVGLAAHPISAAGNMWFSLSWVLGFKEAGWDVWMVESMRSDACVHEDWTPSEPSTSANVAAWQAIVERFGLHGRATLLLDDHADDLPALRTFAAEADLFLNLSGHFREGVITFSNACRVYLDADPAFTQVWLDSYQCDMNFAGHDRFVTVGQRLGEAGSFAPTCGIDWIPCFPPVVLKYWAPAYQEEFNRFTTVAHWEGYKSSEWQGRWFTGKREQFENVIGLPAHVRNPLEVATHVQAHAVELGVFREAGWHFADATTVCRTLPAYEQYVRDSSAEFSVAKGGYVISQTAWFSDRSVCYAASGKPLVLEDTGMRGLLPPGAGVHFFSSMDEAADACERVIRDFANQQRLARRLAEEYFASARVIDRLLKRLGVR
jgi:hypothetical protein